MTHSNTTFETCCVRNTKKRVKIDTRLGKAAVERTSQARLVQTTEEVLRTLGALEISGMTSSVTAYLHKRISFPSGEVSVMSWNRAQEWLAVGTNNGLVKLLKFESGSDAVALNQTIDSVHSSRITAVAWNEPFRKLLSADGSGLVVVWALTRGMWTEEMRNARSSGVVDAHWCSDGQRVLVLYSDGHILSGGVDGKKFWAREIRATSPLRGLSWSPYSADESPGFFLVWTSEAGLVYEAASGEYSHRLFERKEVGRCLWDEHLGVVVSSGAGVEFFASEAAEDSTRLPGVFGRVADLAVIDSETLAVADSANSEVQFWTGEVGLVRVMKLPAGGVGAFSFDGRRRLSIGVQNSLYFASVNRKFLFSLLSDSDTLVSVNSDAASLTVDGVTVRASGTTRIRALAASPVSGFFVTVGDFGASADLDFEDGHASTAVVTVFNSLGSVVDQRDFPPTAKPILDVAVLSNHRPSTGEDSTALDVVLLFPDAVLFWTALATDDANHDLWFSLELNKFLPADLGVGAALLRPADSGETLTAVATAAGASDAALAATSAGRLLLLSRTRQSVATAAVLGAAKTPVLRCFLNREATLAAALDVSGLLTVLRLPGAAAGASGGAVVVVERREVWDFRFSADVAELFAFTEKNRTYIFKGGEADQEPVLLSEGALIGKLENLELCVVSAAAAAAGAAAAGGGGGGGGGAGLERYELKRLREAREILEQVRNFKDAEQYVAANGHPRIWRELVDSCLSRDDLATAERGFVELGDYGGVQLVKRLRTLQGDAHKRRAEIFVYQGEYEEAEQEYAQIGRADLALEMRTKLGDWFRVAQLQQQLQQQGGEAAAAVHREIGDYFRDRGRLREAAEAYRRARDWAREVDVLVNLGDLRSISDLVTRRTVDVAQLFPTAAAGTGAGSEYVRLGRVLERGGFGEAAVQCYVEAGEVGRALECCVSLNDWERALALSREHKLQQTETLLRRYVAHLVETGEDLAAAQVLARAGRATEAAGVLLGFLKKKPGAAAGLSGGGLSGGGSSGGWLQTRPDLVKKILLQVALLVDKERAAAGAAAGAGAGAGLTSGGGATVRGTQAVLQTLVSQERTLSAGRERLLETPWRAVEALHVYLLSQRFLAEGKFEAALRCGTRAAAEYEDVFVELFGPGATEELLWGAYCVSGLLTGQLLQSSKALIRLEQLDEGKWKPIAVSVFKRHLPRDSVALRAQPCPSCRAPVEDHQSRCTNCPEKFAFCVASGKTLVLAAGTGAAAGVLVCRGCRHRTLATERGRLVHCALCHAPLANN